MALFSIPNVSIKGLVSTVPVKEELNSEYDWGSEREGRLFVKTTGIAKRRIARDGQCASDLCFSAAEKVIEGLGWDKSEIQVLVFVSQTPDYITPATAILLQDRLGLPTSCIAFDVNLGCSAYVYGLSIISGLLQNGGIRKGLLLVGDTSSKIVSKKDKSTAPIFSDAGSATALEFDENASPMHFNLQSDGSGSNAIVVPDGGARNRINFDSLKMKAFGKGVIRNRSQMIMRGLDVFNFTVQEVEPNIRALMDFAGKELNQPDFYIFHQANFLLNDRIRQKLGISKEKVPYSLHEYGNTSCATVPVTIASEINKELGKRKLQMVLSGFGVGLSWGSVLVELNKVYCPELMEVD